MSDYSGYKIKRTHSLTPLTSVYEAEAANGQPGRFALKVFHPPASTNIRRSYAIAGWLLAAERQQQSAKKDGAVLEVLAFGRCDEGAFAVYPWQERFLEPFIKTLHSKGNTLRALAECLLNTVEKWETQTGGPHGNLKPANVFLNRIGPLAGMTAQLSDPAFLPGAKPEALRLADLNAVGSMLATIVRRRLPGAWPIEEAPEWKALGHPGKGWLDFCNYLLNPQPGEGEVTIAKARLRLKKVPKDANPAKTAGLTVAALLVLGVVGVVGFARFGNFIYMPDQIQRLAITLKNPTVPKDVLPEWAELCVAWDTWLIDMQSNAPRLLRTKGLLESDDELRRALTEFVAEANNLRPDALIPQAATEKRLGVLGTNPPEAVFNELLITTNRDRVVAARDKIFNVRNQLENWARWDQLRGLQKLMADREFTRVAGALATRLPPARGSAEYGRLNPARTLKFFNEISLDDTGTLPLASRWSEISLLTTQMEESRDRIQIAMPDLILARLVDRSSLSDFADSLESPLEEMRQRRNQFRDPQVVRDRFLKESELQAESADVTLEDFERWEKELFAFTLVPATEDPRLPPAADASKMDASAVAMRRDAVDLERDAPEGETGQPATLGTDDFNREFATVNASLQSLRARPIVRRDVPKVAGETTQLAGVFEQLAGRLTYTLSLLKPETWLAKVALPYGTFTESKMRWAAWQATIRNVTADSLRGVANRPQFRRLRDNERKIKDWIDGLEGPEGFGALKMPNLKGTATDETAQELQRLEADLRERAAAAVGILFRWSDALPTPAWAQAGTNEKAPLEKHSAWLGRVVDFANNLDELAEHLRNGREWREGVMETVVLLRTLIDGEKLAGAPGQSWAEAAELEKLLTATLRAEFVAAAQNGGLSRKLTAWRKLGGLTDWPANAAEFDTDGAVITRMRELVGQGVKDEARRTSLFDEMVKETKARFNRAALFAARAENTLTDMFNRMKGAGLKEADLEPKVAYNHALWNLKRKNPNEKNMNVLRERRDVFVNTVKAIPTAQENVTETKDVTNFLNNLTAIELKEDPNLVRTPSPETVGWKEEVGDEGMSLTATWKSGARVVQMKYRIVTPLDDTPPFFLAERVVAVGEFLDLMAGRPKDAELIIKDLNDWATNPAAAKPYDRPLSWRPRSDFKGLELNSTWIYSPTSMADGLLKNPELRAANPALDQAAVEKPSLKSPLQHITTKAAKNFAEKMLGARLPTTREWQAVLQATEAKAAGGLSRGPNFQKLFSFLQGYEVRVSTSPDPLKTDWRPSTGIYYPNQTAEKSDQGQPSANPDESHLWFREVDVGPKSGDFVNLTGNVSIFLAGGKPDEFFVAGGSVLSPPDIDFTKPQVIGTSSNRIGGRSTTAAFSDVGLRPAFDAPPGFKERHTLLRLVRDQKYLTL